MTASTRSANLYRFSTLHLDPVDGLPTVVARGNDARDLAAQIRALSVYAGAADGIVPARAFPIAVLVSVKLGRNPWRVEKYEVDRFLSSAESGCFDRNGLTTTVERTDAAGRVFPSA